MRRLLIAMLIGASAYVSGCARTRTVLVPPGEPVQLAEPVKAYIYVEMPDGSRVKSENRVVLPEGWWCFPDPD